MSDVSSAELGLEESVDGKCMKGTTEPYSCVDESEDNSRKSYGSRSQNDETSEFEEECSRSLFLTQNKDQIALKLLEESFWKKLCLFIEKHILFLWNVFSVLLEIADQLEVQIPVSFEGIKKAGKEGTLGFTSFMICMIGVFMHFSSFLHSGLSQKAVTMLHCMIHFMFCEQLLKTNSTPLKKYDLIKYGCEQILPFLLCLQISSRKHRSELHSYERITSIVDAAKSRLENNFSRARNERNEKFLISYVSNTNFIELHR